MAYILLGTLVLNYGMTCHIMSNPYLIYLFLKSFYVKILLVFNVNAVYTILNEISILYYQCDFHVVFNEFSYLVSLS